MPACSFRRRSNLLCNSSRTPNRSEIIDHTLAKLRAGVPIRTLLTASALAVTRSSDLPPGHHGGPLHPLVGLHAVYHITERLSGEDRFLSVLQHVALSNKHIHHAGMGPYMLPEFKPIDAGGVEATKPAFLAAVNHGVSNVADHHFLWLWQHVPPVEALDLLLSVAIPKNLLDDHYFIFPALTWRALEWIGLDYVPVLMRPAVRYVTRFPTPPAIPEIDAVLEECQLLTRPLRQQSGADETLAIGSLGEAISRCDTYAEIPGRLGRALADGLSLEGAGEALSIGAAGLFLRSLTGNPMDVHMHTGVNLRRYLVRMDAVRPEELHGSEQYRRDVCGGGVPAGVSMQTSPRFPRHIWVWEVNSTVFGKHQLDEQPCGVTS